MNIVIYARFSCHNQNEQSIEGQLKECYAFAKRNGYTVIGEYIDRALSGTSDNRPEFKRMISDSAKKTFQLVLVYQLDRFARSRLDSATYKAILKRNGVRVVSARENITDDASGILMESVLEGMAEYYSAELAQKVKRGMRLNAEKCLYTGGGVLLGYKVNPDKTFSIDENTAYYVRKIFEMYGSGATVTEINRFLNSQNIKTVRGAEFNKNSLHGILKNKRYIGVYTYKDMEIPDGFPRIISDELFYKVQKIMETNKKAHAHLRREEEFILTTKLFCGKCREMMTGSSGTSKTGKTYRYYVCTHAKKKLCDKKNVGKEFIEDLVVRKCRELLTDENIDIIAKAVVEVAERDIEHSNVSRLEKLIADNERAVGNLMKALEAGEIVEQITARIREKNQEKADLQRQLAEESALHIQLTVPQVKFFLTQLRDGKADNIEYRKTLVTVLVNAIYLYDDKVTFILNVGDKPVEITEELLEDIENNSGVLPLKGKVHHLETKPNHFTMVSLVSFFFTQKVF